MSTNNMIASLRKVRGMDGLFNELASELSSGDPARTISALSQLEEALVGITPLDSSEEVLLVCPTCGHSKTIIITHDIKPTSQPGQLAGLYTKFNALRSVGTSGNTLNTIIDAISVLAPDEDCAEDGTDVDQHPYFVKRDRPLTICEYCGTPF